MKKTKLLAPDILLPIGIVVVLSLLALMVMEETAEGASEGIKGAVRGAQRGVIRSALTVIGILGAARLVLGLAGGPVVWGITAGAWVLSGGYDLVASSIGLPTFTGTMQRIRGVLGMDGGADVCAAPHYFWNTATGRCEPVVKVLP